MPKKKLHIEQLEPGYVLAIVTTEKDYRMAWFINEAIDVKLIKDQSVTKKINKSVETLQFTHYSYYNDVDRYQMHLVNNKSNVGHLITNAKTVDFFLILTGEWSHAHYNIAQEIKKLKVVQTVFEQDRNTLKSSENLLVF